MLNKGPAVDVTQSDIESVDKPAVDKPIPSVLPASPAAESTSPHSVRLLPEPPDAVGPLGWGCRLLNSSRYAHSAQYITILSSYYGFSIQSCNDVIVRKEFDADIPGFIFVLVKR